MTGLEELECSRERRWCATDMNAAIAKHCGEPVRWSQAEAAVRAPSLNLQPPGQNNNKQMRHLAPLADTTPMGSLLAYSAASATTANPRAHEHFPFDSRSGWSALGPGAISFFFFAKRKSGPNLGRIWAKSGACESQCRGQPTQQCREICTAGGGGGQRREIAAETQSQQHVAAANFFASGFRRRF